MHIYPAGKGEETITEIKKENELWGKTDNVYHTLLSLSYWVAYDSVFRI